MDTAAGALGLEVFKILFCFVSVVLGLRCYAQAFSCGFSLMGFPWSSVGKESTCSAGDPGSIPGLGRSPGEGNGNLLQYPCLENLMDRGAWWAAVHGAAKSWARLSDQHLLTSFVVSRGFSLLQIMGFSLHWFLLCNTGSRLPSFSSCSTQAQ